MSPSVRAVTNGAPDIPPVASDAVPGSLLDRLRSRAADAQRGRLLDKPVPGWQGALLLRFKPLEIGQLERFLDNRGKGQKSSQISEGIDALATCCVGVFGVEEDGSLTELPARLDNRLAVLLDMPIPDGAQLTAREVVLNLFGGNAFSLGKFIDEVVEWMGDPDATGGDPGES